MYQAGLSAFLLPEREELTMTTPRRSSFTRFFALLFAMSLLVTACPSEDTAPTDDRDEAAPISGSLTVVVEGEEEQRSCDAYTDSGSSLDGVVARLCTLGLDDDDLGRIQVAECDDPSLTPRIFYEIDEGEPSLAFFFHMMVRFHPVDELNDGPPNATPYRPADEHKLELADGKQVWVLDTGDHGEFASLVIAEMLQIDPSTISRVDLNTASLASTLDPGAPLVSVDLANRAPSSSSGLLTTEADIVATINDMIEYEEVDLASLVVNMSFGAYNCGEEPPELRVAIKSLVDAGAQVIASAGNDETNERIWPAGWADDRDLGESVTSVGSIVTGEDTRSCFSNYGDHVETWVPGEEVVTDMGQWSGTSFAAPQITALIAAGEDPGALHRSAPNDPPDMVEIALEVGGEDVVRGTYCTEESGYGPKGAEY